MIARVHMTDVGTGIVLAVHSTLQEARAQTPRDRDGVAAEETRYWRVPETVRVGDIVGLSWPA